MLSPARLQVTGAASTAVLSQLIPALRPAGAAGLAAAGRHAAGTELGGPPMSPARAHDFGRIPVYPALSTVDRRDPDARPLKSPTALLQPDRKKRRPGKSEETERAEQKGTCKGSLIKIVVRKDKDLSGTFTKKPLDAMLASSSAEISVPKSATAIEQDELGPGTLEWSCPSGKSGTNKGVFKHFWRLDDSELTKSGNEKIGYDGHTYGLCCRPGSDAREAAEKKGFDMDRCNWTFVEEINFQTRAVSKSKTMHRCKWGFRFEATHRVGKKGAATKKATVDYWGVDKVIEM